MSIFNWGQSVVMTHRQAHAYVEDGAGAEFKDFAGIGLRVDDVPVAILTYNSIECSIDERLFWMTRYKFQDVSDWDVVMAKQTSDHTYYSGCQEDIVSHLLSEYFGDVVKDFKAILYILMERGYQVWREGDKLYTKDLTTHEVEFCFFDGETVFDDLEWMKETSIKDWTEESAEALFEGE